MTSAGITSRGRRPRFGSLVVALAMLAGCAPYAASTSAPGAGGALVDTDWRLVELEGKAVVAPPGPRGLHLRFLSEGARVAGDTGCNNLLGGYRLEGAQLHFGGSLATTRMACLDPKLAEQERAFLGALEATERFTISGDRLVLYQADRPVAVFQAGASR